MNNSYHSRNIKIVGSYNALCFETINKCIISPYGEEPFLSYSILNPKKIILLSGSSPRNCKQGYALYIKFKVKGSYTNFHTQNVLTNQSLLLFKLGHSLNGNDYAAVNGITAHREAMKNTSKLMNLPCGLLSFTSRKGTLCYS